MSEFISYELEKNRRQPMLIKPMPAPVDPTKVCKTCGHHDPDLHVCSANDYAIRNEDANTMSCSSWEPKKEKSVENPKNWVVRGAETDMQKHEEDLPSGACCFTCEHRDKLSMRCKLNISDAVLTVQRAEHECCGSWEPEKNHGVTLRVVDPDEEKKREDTYRMYFRRGRTIEQLDTVFDIACHMYPECADRWRATQTAVKDTMAAYTKMQKQQEASHE